MQPSYSRIKHFWQRQLFLHCPQFVGRKLYSVILALFAAEQSNSRNMPFCIAGYAHFSKDKRSGTYLSIIAEDFPQNAAINYSGHSLDSSKIVHYYICIHDARTSFCEGNFRITEMQLCSETSLLFKSARASMICFSSFCLRLRTS